jgi:hypothetical protein
MRWLSLLTDKKRIPIAVLAGVTALNALTAAENPLETAVRPASPPWASTVQEWKSFFSEHHFEWVNEAKNVARGDKLDATFFGLPVTEALLHFQDGKVSQIDLSIYNRGDLDAITPGKFQELIAKTAAALDQATGVKPMAIKPTSMQKPGRASESRLWKTPGLFVRMDTAHSESERHGLKAVIPEFLNLAITPPDELADHQRQAGKQASLGVFEKSERIKTNSEGDLYLAGLPMVDQGQKGYCATASAERVLRYYGSDVSQHEIAQHAGSSGELGTGVESYEKALRSLSRGLGLKTTVLESRDDRDFFKTVEDYNRAAKKKKKPPIELPRGGTIVVSDVYQAMDRDIFLEMRKRNDYQIKKFLKDTEERIETGIPILWGVMLGFVQEKPELPQAFGGHMRIIYGVNPQTKEILYTDSWGRGHEAKRMAADDAYAITISLMTLEMR